MVKVKIVSIHKYPTAKPQFLGFQSRFPRQLAVVLTPLEMKRAVKFDWSPQPD